MERSNAVVQMMPATHKTGLQIDIDKLCGNAVREGNLVSPGRSDDSVALSAMLFIDILRRRQALRRIYQPVHPHRFKYSLPVLH
jgi:hypothetical protein